MDNSSRANWSSSPSGSNSSSNKPPANAFANLALKPSPLSSRTTSPAVGRDGSGSRAGAKSGDSFASLVSFGKDKQASNLSLIEQQRQLQEQKRRDEEEKQKQMDAAFGGGGASGSDAGFWDSLGGGARQAQSTPNANDDEDDILAAFNSAAPVDKSSHYPVPGSYQGAQSQKGTPMDAFDDLLGGGSYGTPSPAPIQNLDPFDVENLPSRNPSPYNATPPPQPSYDDDFDILGDLAKPVSELPRPKPTPAPRAQRQPSPPPADDPRDAAIAEIVDMGFTPEQAVRALEHTESGIDSSAAVSWLLDEAHRKSRPATQEPSGRSSGSRDRQGPSQSRRRPEDNNVPAWARTGSDSNERDISQRAAEVGGNLFKSANSLWSAGRKKVERAVAEFQADTTEDPNTPRWMRERQIREQLEARGARGITRNDRPPPEDNSQPDRKPKQPEPNITDEALMLEMGGGPPPPRRKQREERKPTTQSVPPDHNLDGMKWRDEKPAAVQPSSRFRDEESHRAASAIPDSSTRKAKLAAEADSGAYVSRNRRRPPPPSSASSKPPTPSPEPDLLNGSSSTNPFARDVAASRLRPAQPTTPARTPPPQRAPPARRPTPPTRSIPALPPSDLAASNSARARGTAAFKLGDFAAAQTHYTSSLTPIPPTHPLLIPLLTNRALTTIKLGDPKTALLDLDRILTLIGPSYGADESITIDDTPKPMREYYTKAVARRAECFEALEKWAEAKESWELAIAANVPGASAGKQRCISSMAPKQPPKPKAPVRAKVVSLQSVQGKAAVQALRDANQKQDDVEAEKLALYDSVEARLNAWKNGKEGNLRALLAGLDTVLWEGSGWKKVGLGELLVPQKVKVWYMKGIAKVHPDKIKQDATTEQRMLSAAVFSLLNDAWDKFKAENGL